MDEQSINQDPSEPVYVKNDKHNAENEINGNQLNQLMDAHHDDSEWSITIIYDMTEKYNIIRSQLSGNRYEKKDASVRGWGIKR